ncbi:isopentenyl-diphosphate Delta-isomerase [Streptomonospora arabica]|uniref:Isopentenyl-diphosphate delta-isomerase n=1 Tax=Streptomonospora arabica TaxID=412417 RepID=A0ABV9SKX5_9ACTN
MPEKTDATGSAESPGTAAEERVVLLDGGHRPVGTADKRLVHGPRTPLHLAFSCYVFDPGGRLLVTRRALDKTAWPGVWTNSFCGHPGPGEPMEAALHRRAREELGISLEGVAVLLPEFAYRAADASGIVENEFCPVYRAATRDTPRAPSPPRWPNGSGSSGPTSRRWPGAPPGPSARGRPARSPSSPTDHSRPDRLPVGRVQVQPGSPNTGGG